MPRISPAQAPDRTAGFSLIEIVVALAICTVLIYPCMTSLTMSLRAEQTAGRAREIELACERVAAMYRAGLDPKDAGLPYEMTSDEALFDSKAWTVWQVSLPGTHGLVGRLEFRM